MTLLQVEFPYLHLNVDLTDICDSNAKLLTEIQIQAVKAFLADQPDNARYRKGLFLNGEQALDRRYGIIKMEGRHYAVYRGLRQEKALGVTNKLSNAALVTSSVKLVQDLDSGEWLALKVVVDHFNNPAAKRLEVEKEFNNLKKVGMARGQIISRETRGVPKERKTKFFMLMKLARGMTLIDFTDSPYRLPALRMIEIALQVLQKVQDLHSNKLLHCDIKPENGVYDAGSHTTQLVDFDALGEMDAFGQVTQQFQGTNIHIAPELYDRFHENRKILIKERNAQGKPVDNTAVNNRAILSNYIYDEKTEIYALGILLKILFKLPIVEVNPPTQKKLDVAEIFLPGLSKETKKAYDTARRKHAAAIKDIADVNKPDKTKAKEEEKKYSAEIKRIIDTVMVKNPFATAIMINFLDSMISRDPVFRPTVEEAKAFFQGVRQDLLPKTQIKVGILDVDELNAFWAVRDLDQHRYFVILLQKFDEICIVSKNPLTNIQAYYKKLIKIQLGLRICSVPCRDQIFITPDTYALCEVPAAIAAADPDDCKVARTYTYLDGRTYNHENVHGLTGTNVETMKAAQDASQLLLQKSGIDVVTLSVKKRRSEYMREINECFAKVSENDFIDIVGTLLDQCKSIEREAKARFGTEFVDTKPIAVVSAVMPVAENHVAVKLTAAAADTNGIDSEEKPTTANHVDTNHVATTSNHVNNAATSTVANHDDANHVISSAIASNDTDANPVDTMVVSGTSKSNAKIAAQALASSASVVFRVLASSPAPVTYSPEQEARYRWILMQQTVLDLTKLRNKDQLSYATVNRVLSSLQKDPKFVGGPAGMFGLFRPACVTKVETLKSKMDPTMRAGM